MSHQLGDMFENAENFVECLVTSLSHSSTSNGSMPHGARADSRRSKFLSVQVTSSLFLLLLTSTLLFFSPSVAAQETTKRILILSGSDPNHPGFSKITRNIQSTLRERLGVRVELRYELQQGLTDPPNSPGDDEELIAYLKRKYNDKHIDLVLVMVAPRFRQLVQKDRELFQSVPKIFYEFDSERDDTNRILGPNITGVWAALDLYKTLDLALALQPDTRKVVVVSGNGPEDKLKRERAQLEFRKYESKAEFSYLASDTLEEVRSQLNDLPKESLVIFLSFTRDSLGNVYSLPEAFSLIAPASNAPIYGYSDSLMGLGITGGDLLDFEGIGKRIGEMSLRVLGGESPGQVPQEVAPTVLTVDWRELERWGLISRAIPPGSVVRFRQPSFWELYKWHIIGLVGAVVIEAMLIAWLLFTQGRRRQAEEEARHLSLVIADQHKHLNEVVSNVPGVVWEVRIDPETGTRKTTFVSEYVNNMLGYSEEEFLSFTGFGSSLILEEDRERVARESEAALAGKGGAVQFRWLAKDEHVVWVEAHLAPILDDTGTIIGMRGVTLDTTDQKISEHARKQSEERNRAILQAIPDQVFLLTRDGFFLDYRGDGLVHPEGLLGKNVRDVFPPELAGEFLRHFEHSIKDETQIFEFEFSLNDSERWFEARVVQSGQNILSVIRDVTSRKSIENALRQNEAQLAGIIGSAMDGIITVDEGQQIVLFNTAAEKMFQCSAKTAIGQSLQKFIPDLGQLDKIGVFDQTNITRRAVGIPGNLVGLRNPDEKFPIEASISQLELNEQRFWTVILRDVTERKQAEEALRQSEERFRNMADTAPVMIWVSGPDKLRTYFNQNWLKSSGRSIEQELGNGWAERVHEDDYIRLLDIYGLAFERHQRFQIEYRLRRADGEFRWVLDHGAPQLSSSGEFLGFIGSCIDITERRDSEEALRRAMAELNQLKNELEAENFYLQEALRLDQPSSEMVGQSDAIKYVKFKINQVAPTDSTVLVTGETGTGKELVAHAIHTASARKDRPLIKVNCAALSPSLIESELFGHEKGAFTGAASRKLGRFELANGGTIFLDEIGELPAELQVKLLRVIQEGEFERLGGTKTIKVDVRIIAATNRDLKAEVEEKTFRQDLWYRLNVFPVTIPPLRQRMEDIPLLVQHFVASCSKKFGKDVTSLSANAMRSLQGHSWPGNIRELANVIERAVIYSQSSVLQLVDRFEQVREEASLSEARSLEEMEREYIVRTLESTGWRIEGHNGAAKILGLNPSTLRARMNKLQIQRPGNLHFTPAGHS